MWTIVGIVSFATYGLTRLATNPVHAWRVNIINDKNIFHILYTVLF